MGLPMNRRVLPASCRQRNLRNVCRRDVGSTLLAVHGPNACNGSSCQSERNRKQAVALRASSTDQGLCKRKNCCVPLAALAVKLLVPPELTIPLVIAVQVGPVKS